MRHTDPPSGPHSEFGQLLRQSREATGLSRDALAQRVGIDPSYIYRIEMGARRPSRETSLAFAEALGVGSDDANKWLLAAGYAPLPLLTMVRSAVRARGGRRSRGSAVDLASAWDAARWATSLEAMGLREGTIQRLLQALETVTLPERHGVAQAVRATFSRMIDYCEAPVRYAVIPAAGGQHGLLATHVMQRMILRAIDEAVASGITRIVLILAPGTVEPLFIPIQEALNVAAIPAITLDYVEQARPDGLGDAVLQVEAKLGQSPFAVLLPDDVLSERARRKTVPREIHHMMSAFKRVQGAHILALTSVPRSRMPVCGVARVDSTAIDGLRPIVQLVEKPEHSHSIANTSSPVFGIVGRYLLQPDVFRALRELKEKGSHPLHLTDALELLREQGQKIFGLELKAGRKDVGAAIEEASRMIGDSSNSLIAM